MTNREHCFQLSETKTSQVIIILTAGYFVSPAEGTKVKEIFKSMPT